MFRTPYSPCPQPNHPECNIEHARLALEAKCLRYAFRRLKTAGWRPTHVTVDHVSESVDTEAAALTEVFSADESSIRFFRRTHPHSMLVVLGNGIDCMVDYTVCGRSECNFDDIMSEAYEHIENIWG